MNQSILCNDDLAWDEATQQVRFTAQAAGAHITCYLALSYLKKAGLSSSSAAEIVEFCESIQFDIEEDAQQAIADEHLEGDKLYLT